MKSLTHTLLVLSLFLLPRIVSAQLTQFSIGSTGNELATNVCPLASDGSTIIAGYTYNIVSGAVANCQCYVLKVTSTGTIAWQKKFGIAGRDNVVLDMIITQDNSIV